MDKERVREEFNSVAQDHRKEGYEFWRWKSNPNKRTDFEQTRISIEKHLVKKAKNALEIGCGPGTWTKMIVKKTENLDLLDISKEMLNEAKSVIGNRANYILGDFEKHIFPEQSRYDLIVSIRALEYMSDKEAVVEKLFTLLRKGGRVFIITKNPYAELRKRVPFIGMFSKTPEIHTGWIYYRDLEKLFRKAGFRDIKTYPVVWHPYFVYRTKIHNTLTRQIHKKTHNKPIGDKCRRFIESYLITAKR